MRALLSALLLLLLLATGCGSAPPAPDSALDGLWRAITIDRAPVGRTDFLIRIRGGRVVGGKDGCNSWAFDMTRPPEPDGTRSIASDLIGCSAIPQRPAYWRALGNGNVVPTLTAAGELRIAAGGSELRATRVAVPAARP